MKKLGFILFMSLGGLTQIGCGSNDPPPPPITAATATNINNCLTGTTSIGYNCPPQLAQATAGLREVPVTPTTLNAGQILANNQAAQTGLPVLTPQQTAVLGTQGVAVTPVAPGIATLNPALAEATPAAVKAQSAMVTAALAADTENPESMHYNPAVAGTVASSPASAGSNVTAAAQQISSSLSSGAAPPPGTEAAR